MKNKRINSLITLLKDDNNTIAITAMHELLQYGTNSKDMNNILSELQETKEVGLRKKVHQIQAIQRSRYRRRVLSKRLTNKKASLLQGLADLNVIWYDEFGANEISNTWRELIHKAAKEKIRSAKKIASFMKNASFSICTENFQDADLFCLGAAIEDKVGADIILASIALEIGRSCGLFGSIVHLKKGFGVLFSTKQSDPNSQNYYGEIIIPIQDWEVVKPETELPFEIWSNNKVLKYVAAMLFSNAIYSEAPRYIQILASCLSGHKENDDLSNILPFPFGDNK